MYIPVYRSQDNHPFPGALQLFQVIFQMGDRPLHHLCRLKDKRQDELPGTKFVADLFHRGEKDMVKNLDSYLMLGQL